MTEAGFAEALDGAKKGVVVTDYGADERLDGALYDIAAHGATPEREAEARAAFDALRRN